MEPFDEATRASLAREWTNSSEDQAAFAKRHGISARTLRGWVKIYAPRRPVEEVKAIVQEAIGKLQALLAGLDVEGAACRAAGFYNNSPDSAASGSQSPRPGGGLAGTGKRLSAEAACRPAEAAGSAASTMRPTRSAEPAKAGDERADGEAAEPRTPVQPLGSAERTGMPEPTGPRSGADVEGGEVQPRKRRGSAIMDL